MFRSSSKYISRKLLGMSSEEEKLKRRLELDLADILTGTTCSANASRLATLAAIDPHELAIAMKEAADRYLAGLQVKE